jgi:hypothetical protein
MGDGRVVRLIGVYNAEGSLRGEVAYWLGARLGRAHCALCDVTHGAFRQKAGWRQCRAGLPVPFDTYHLDDRPAALTQFPAPAVFAETPGGMVLLLGPEPLERCEGSPQRLLEALESAVEQRGLEWSQPAR